MPVIEDQSRLTESTPEQKRRSIILIVFFTLVAAVAQLLIKTGANRLGEHPTILGVATDWPLIAGLALYGLGAAIMIVALQHGELSVLYPLISLSYVWVVILSVIVLKEVMNPLRVAGIAVIIAGVAILGRGGRR